jgi:hypothetical protein
MTYMTFTPGFLRSDAKKAAADAATRETALTDATKSLKKQLEQKSLDLVDARTKLAAAESAANRAAADAKAQVYAYHTHITHRQWWYSQNSIAGIKLLYISHNGGVVKIMSHQTRTKSNSAIGKQQRIPSREDRQYLSSCLCFPEKSGDRKNLVFSLF